MLEFTIVVVVGCVHKTEVVLYNLLFGDVGQLFLESNV